MGIDRQESIVSIDILNEVAEMVGPDDPELLVELIDDYLTDTDALIAGMPSILASGDLVSLQRAAHSLKSTSATFGVMPLSELSKGLENALRDQVPEIDHADMIQQMTQLHEVSRAELEAEKVQRLA